MTIGIFKSPNPRNRNSISMIKWKFLSVSSMNTLLAILIVTDARRDVILVGGLYHRFPWRHLPFPLPGMPSMAGGFESYDSHQLLCSWKVEVNSEPFRIARFTRGFYTHLDLFGGSKMVQYDWLLASQSGCCRFDPVCPKAWVVFSQRLKCEKSKSCDVLL